MPGTTGDIIWRRTDPKTVELYNVDRGSKEALPEWSPAQAEEKKELERRYAEDALSAAGKATTDAERLALMNPYARDPRRKLSAEEKHEHNQRLKDFMKFWKKSDPTEFDPTDGIQELLDGGIMWHDQDGWGTYSGLHMSPKDRRAFISAADAWGDRVGAYNPDGTYNPNAARTYWEQQQNWDERDKILNDNMRHRWAAEEKYHKVYP
jgi:hypothetical protein